MCSELKAYPCNRPKTRNLSEMALTTIDAGLEIEVPSFRARSSKRIASPVFSIMTITQVPIQYCNSHLAARGATLAKTQNADTGSITPPVFWSFRSQWRLIFKRAGLLRRLEHFLRRPTKLWFARSSGLIKPAEWRKDRCRLEHLIIARLFRLARER